MTDQLPDRLSTDPNQFYVAGCSAHGIASTARERASCENAASATAPSARRAPRPRHDDRVQGHVEPYLQNPPRQAEPSRRSAASARGRGAKRPARDNMRRVSVCATWRDAHRERSAAWSARRRARRRILADRAAVTSNISIATPDLGPRWITMTSPASASALRAARHAETMGPSLPCALNRGRLAVAHATGHSAPRAACRRASPSPTRSVSGTRARASAPYRPAVSRVCDIGGKVLGCDGGDLAASAQVSNGQPAGARARRVLASHQ